MIRSTRISLGLFFNYFLSLTKIDLGQNYISLPSIKSSTHIALLFMASMGTQKLKAQGFFIFSLLLTLILFCITTLYNENTNVKLIPQMNYLMVVVALFFLNAVIFLFMLMKYFTNKQILPTLILSLAFLSGLIYLVETIVIIHKPINGSTLIQTKSNDVSIFYIFRQLSFICLTSLALFCYGKDNILDNNKKKTGILLLALIPFLVFPLLAHNLSSYNADYRRLLPGQPYCDLGNQLYKNIGLFVGIFTVLYYHAYTISQRTMAVNSIIMSGIAMLQLTSTDSG